MKKTKIPLWWKLLIIFSIFFLLLSLFAPLIFTQPAKFDIFNFSTISENIGSTFAIMNPFIAIAAALITFLAFLIQYDANNKMVNENRVQEATNRFYEMLKIHKENVLELKYTYADNLTENNQQNVHFTEYEGRRLFYYYIEEFKCIYNVIDSINKNPESNEDIRKNIVTAYNIFYKGFFGDSDESLRAIFMNAASLVKSESNYQDFYERISESVDASLYENRVKKQVKSVLRELWLLRGFFLKQPPFSGHFQRLNNYYRHLFLTVKLVVEDRNLSYENKRNLLRILRAQLTNDEQLMLFYNWISGHGIQWEATKDHPEKNNQFFSKYRMIHNISPDSMIFIEEENLEEKCKKFISFLKDIWLEGNYPSKCWNEKKEKEPDYGPIFEFEDWFEKGTLGFEYPESAKKSL